MSPSPSPDTILLVEPDRDNREMYSEALRYYGFVVVPVATATEALGAAAQAALVVTALLLPGEADGIDLIRRLRLAPGTARVPIVVVSASRWKDERARALAAGCDAFLEKPCLPEVLVGEIRRVLRLRRIPSAPPLPAALPDERHRRKS